MTVVYTDLEMTYPDEMAKATKTPMTTDRERVVSVRLSEKENAQITEAAERLGLRISQYIRLAALEKAGQK